MMHVLVGLIFYILMFGVNVDVLAVDLVVAIVYEDQNCTKLLDGEIPCILANTCVRRASYASIKANCTTQTYKMFYNSSECEGDAFELPMDQCEFTLNYRCKEFPDNKVVNVRHGAWCDGNNLQSLDYEESVVLNTCFEYPKTGYPNSFRITLSGDVLTYTRYSDSAKCEGQSVSDNFFVDECKMSTVAGSGRRLQGSEAMQISAAVPGVILDGSSSRTNPSLFSVLVLAGVMVATLNA